MKNLAFIFLIFFGLLYSIPLMSQQQFPTQMEGEYLCEIRYGCASSFKVIIETDTADPVNFFLTDSCPNFYSGTLKFEMRGATNEFWGLSSSPCHTFSNGNFFPSEDSLYLSRSILGCGGSGCSSCLEYKCKKVFSTDIEENQLSKLSIAPNPTNGLIELSNLEININYTLLDAQGRKTLDGEIEKNNGKINITELSPGLYYLQLESEKGFVVKKIIKQ